jgi:hypothetical protein
MQSLTALGYTVTLDRFREDMSANVRQKTEHTASNILVLTHKHAHPRKHPHMHARTHAHTQPYERRPYSTENRRGQSLHRPRQLY